MGGKGKQPAPWGAPAAAPKRVRVTRKGSAENGQESSSSARELEGSSRSQAAEAAGPGATPVVLHADVGVDDTGCRELQQLLPKKLNLDQAFRGGAHAAEHMVLDSPSHYGATYRPPFSRSEAISALGTSDVLSNVFQHLDNVAFLNAKLVCKDWNITIERSQAMMKKVEETGIKDIKEMRRLEDLLVLAPPITTLIPENEETIVQQNMLFNSHRRILVDWLVDVQGEYNLSNQTLHTAIQLVDRCLLINPAIQTNFIQLLGITCLFISSKFCEVLHPLVREMVWVCDNSYTLNQHLDMEVSVMMMLQFKFYTVTPASFIDAFCHTLSLDTHTSTAALYISDLIMMESDSVGNKPSMIAIASIALALAKLRLDVPIYKLSLLSRVSEDRIRKLCCRAQHLLHADYTLEQPSHGSAGLVFDGTRPPLRAIHDRYGLPANQSLSKQAPPPPLMVQCTSSRCCPDGRQNRIVCYWCCKEECSTDMRALYHCDVIDCRSELGCMSGVAAGDLSPSIATA